MTVETSGIYRAPGDEERQALIGATTRIVLRLIGEWRPGGPPPDVSDEELETLREAGRVGLGAVLLAQKYDQRAKRVLGVKPTLVANAAAMLAYRVRRVRRDGVAELERELAGARGAIDRREFSYVVVYGEGPASAFVVWARSKPAAERRARRYLDARGRQHDEPDVYPANYVRKALDCVARGDYEGGDVMVDTRAWIGEPLRAALLSHARGDATIDEVAPLPVRLPDGRELPFGELTLVDVEQLVRAVLAELAADRAAVAAEWAIR